MITRPFLERRQSQEKRYSFHPERCSVNFHRADELALTAAMFGWLNVSFLLSFPGGAGRFDFDKFALCYI